VSAACWRNRLFAMPVMITDVYHHDPLLGEDFSSISMVNRSGYWQAVAWPCLPTLGAADLFDVCEATLLDIREDTAADPVALVQWDAMDSVSVFDLIPDSHCPLPGTVLQTCELIKSISSVPLRHLMAKVLRTPDVHQTFWECSASLTHHHAFPGGLALHSLEVAVAGENVRALDSWQRDLVIVYALLHDIGKVWSYSNGILSKECRRLGHELIGYRKLKPLLAMLQQEDEQTGATLDALLSGTWKRSFQHPAAALGEIVRAMDRFSAARGVGNASTCRVG